MGRRNKITQKFCAGFALLIMVTSVFSGAISAMDMDTNSNNLSVNETTKNETREIAVAGVTPLAVCPTLATIDNGYVHAEIGNNQYGGGPGVIHLWNKQAYPDSAPNKPHDVMWYGQIEYIQVDGIWGTKETGGTVQQVSSTKAVVTHDTNPIYKLEITIETIPDYPAIKTTYKLTNKDTTTHNYTVHYADDYCAGGYGGDGREFLYLWNNSTALETSRWYDALDTRAIIWKLNSAAEIDQDWTFIGCCEPGTQFYVGPFPRGYNNPTNTPIGSNIKNADDTSSIRFGLGDLSPSSSKSVSFYIGCSDSHTKIDKIAEDVIPVVGADAGPDQTVGRSQPVTFNASGSTSVGTIIKYEWDLDNDGVYDVSVDTPIYVYEGGWTELGEYIVGLRVTDDKGWTDTDTKDNRSAKR